MFLFCTLICFLENGGGSVAQKSVIFITIVVQQSLANCQVVAIVLTCELFWNPSSTNFMKAKSVLDDSISRILNNAWTIRHFIDGHPFTYPEPWHGLILFLFGGCGWSSLSLFISETCATVSEHQYPFIHT
jgi:hypothetical protein